MMTYESYYSLEGRPFQLTPDPRFYFASASHKKALSYLGYGLSQGEGFIVVTGEIGAGKSTLVAHLMERIDPATLTVAHIVTSALAGEELIHFIARKFGLPVEGRDKVCALGALERFLQDEARAGRRCLLIVDECQNLDFAALEELRMLSNFQLGSHPLLQCLILGQPEFRRTLAHHPSLEQLRQRIIASHHLEALGPGEIEEYVRHRLEQVGWCENPALADGLIEALFKQTAGVPRRINQTMNRLLLFGAIGESEELTPEMLEEVCIEMEADQSKGTPAERDRPLAGEHSDQPSEETEVRVSQEAAVSPDRAPEVEALLAERDMLSANLEAAIGELQALGRASGSGSGSGSGSMAEDGQEQLNAAVERLENRLEEQERSFRHVLAMLIEWLEGEASREAA